MDSHTKLLWGHLSHPMFGNPSQRRQGVLMISASKPYPHSHTHTHTHTLASHHIRSCNSTTTCIYTAPLKQDHCRRLKRDSAFLTGKGNLDPNLVDKIVLHLYRIYPQILNETEAEKTPCSSWPASVWQQDWRSSCITVRKTLSLKAQRRRSWASQPWEWGGKRGDTCWRIWKIKPRGANS
eukprot:gi/632970281/ref/XP_007901561.1/ PREDICTED: bcl10-interacting CARD protein isoform X3 [Callorhinchus milii]